jgi:hypothetical protein
MGAPVNPARRGSAGQPVCGNFVTERHFMTPIAMAPETNKPQTAPVPGETAKPGETKTEPAPVPQK